MATLDCAAEKYVPVLHFLLNKTDTHIMEFRKNIWKYTLTSQKCAALFQKFVIGKILCFEKCLLCLALLKILDKK